MATVNKFQFYQLKLVGIWRGIKRILGFNVPPVALDELEESRQAVLEFANQILQKMLHSPTSFDHFLLCLNTSFENVLEVQWMVNGIDMEEMPLCTLLVITHRANLIDDRRLMYFLPKCEELDNMWRNGELTGAPPLVCNDPQSVPVVNAAKQYYTDLKTNKRNNE